MRLRPLSLRHRTTIAFTLMGLLLSLMFAFATDWMADDYEATLVQEILRSQAEDYGARLVADPTARLPRTRRLSGYLRRGDGTGDVPRAYAGLAPGFYEPDDEEASGAHVGVFDSQAGRLYFVVDLSAIESFERHLDWATVLVLVLGTVVSGWLGWLLAGGALRPVRRLAEAVDALPTQPRPSMLAGTVSDDDLGRLASAIDRYQARLVAADAHERAFFADASHELRTPISVVRGAAEVLVEEPGADAGMRRRLRRLDRGVRELTDLLDLLLGMASRRAPLVEDVDTLGLLEEAAGSLVGGPEDARVEIDVHASGSLHLSRHESLLLLRAAIRRVVPPETAGELRISAYGCVIDLVFLPEYGGPQQADADMATRSDLGRLPRLAGRLAEQMGWRLESLDDAARSAGGLRLSLPDGARVRT